MQARAAIAAHLLPGGAETQLGDVRLVPHQVDAVRRLASLLAAHGGALLADDVGLGKTFVALAVARGYPSALVIAPAALLGMWRDSITRARLQVAVTSYESLSRGPPPPVRAALVILDEAHHARSSTARRYPRIAELTRGAHTLLLTATPVPNRLEELRSLMALFLGSLAMKLSPQDVSALTVRRTSTTVPMTVLPKVAPPRWIEVRADSSCIEALERLPPAVPPADGGDGGALLLLGLVRQWASSRAALVATLRRRLARSIAMRDSVAAGHMPSSAELRTWEVVDESVQLAFPELLTAPVTGSMDRSLLAETLRTHCDAVSSMLSLLARTRDPDEDRADRIRHLREAHHGERIVCFTEYAATAYAYWRRLRALPGVACLTARGGAIASGRVSRDEVLRRFAPDGQRSAGPSRIGAISTLITTDLLSEGVDLRDATVVVHLDLPWSPARMEQRVGRARRLGSPAAAITVYALRPPAPADLVLSLERRLRQKVAMAASAVGCSAKVLPDPGDTEAGAASTKVAGSQDAAALVVSGTERGSRVIDRVAAWAAGCDVTSPRDADAHAHAQSDAVVAAIAAAPEQGWLAAITVGSRTLLVASIGGRTGSDPELLDRACSHAEDDSEVRRRQPQSSCEIVSGSCSCVRARRHGLLDAALAAASRHAAACAAAAAIDQTLGDTYCARVAHRPGGIRQRVVARIHRALSMAPASERPRIATLAAAARRTVGGRLPAGTEARLNEMLGSIGDDTAWLHAVAALGTEGPRAGDGGAGVDDGHGCGAAPAYRLRAIIAFGPIRPCPA